MADDLYQEFFLTICEIKDDRLIEANNKKFLEVFCVGIINNIWNKRDRVKTYENGSTSPLYELSGNCFYIKQEEREWQEGKAAVGSIVESHIPGGEEFDIDKALKHERVRDHIKELIETAKESEDRSERFRARVFYYSTFEYKNPRRFAAAAEIPYKVCREARNQFRDQLTKKLNDLYPDRGL